MDRLPVTYYRVGQSVMLDEFPGKPAKVGEITGLFIRIFFGPDLHSAWRLQAVSPEFIKPILRPLSQIRISHVIGLYRVMAPASTLTDDEIIVCVNRNPDVIEVWADSTKPCLWLLEQGYDVQELIKQNLAVAEEA